MPTHRFEEADTDDHTQLGERLTRVARATGRLETGHRLGTYVLRHDDGCEICGTDVSAGSPFSLDPETDDLRCAAHGRTRRDER